MIKRMIKGYKCPRCKRRHKFSAWVYAHAHVEIIHTCECRARNIIYNFQCTGTEEKKK